VGDSCTGTAGAGEDQRSVAEREFWKSVFLEKTGGATYCDFIKITMKEVQQLNR
jgi:hypothetical protein